MSNFQIIVFDIDTKQSLFQAFRLVYTQADRQTQTDKTDRQTDRQTSGGKEYLTECKRNENVQMNDTGRQTYRWTYT